MNPLWRILCSPNFQAIRHRILRALPMHSLWALAEAEENVIFDAWPDEDYGPNVLGAARSILQPMYSEHASLRACILQAFRPTSWPAHVILDEAMANNCPYSILHEVWTVAIPAAEQKEYAYNFPETDDDMLNQKTGHDYGGVVEFVWQDMMLNGDYSFLHTRDNIAGIVEKFIAGGCRLPAISSFMMDVRLHINRRYTMSTVNMYKKAVYEAAMPLMAEIFASASIQKREALTRDNDETWNTLLNGDYESIPCHKMQIIPLIQHMIQWHGMCFMEQFWELVRYTAIDDQEENNKISAFLAQIYATSMVINDDEYDFLHYWLINKIQQTTTIDKLVFCRLRDYFQPVLRRFASNNSFQHWIGFIEQRGINSAQLRADWNI